MSKTFCYLPLAVHVVLLRFAVGAHEENRAATCVCIHHYLGRSHVR